MDLSSWKIESISRIGLLSQKRNHFFGGGRRVGILDTDVTRQGPKKKRPKEVSGEKIDLQIFPHFLSNQCPMNLSASCILMVLNLAQGKTS